MSSYPNKYHKRVMKFLTTRATYHKEYYAPELLEEIADAHTMSGAWNVISVAGLHATYILWDNYAKAIENFTGEPHDPARRARNLVGEEIITTMPNTVKNDAWRWDV